MLPSPSTAKLAAGLTRREATKSDSVDFLEDASAVEEVSMLSRPVRDASVLLAAGDNRDAPKDPYS